jgi:hypothetical protein
LSKYFFIKIKKNIFYISIGGHVFIKIIKLVCSFCRENGHRANKCPEKFRDFDENDLLNTRFEDFFKNVLTFSLYKDDLQIQANYKYLNKKYVTTNKYDAKSNENVLKVIICESASLRNSFDSNIDEYETNHTFFVILPTKYNKNEINVRNVMNSFELADNSMMINVEYIIKNLFWI